LRYPHNISAFFNGYDKLFMVHFTTLYYANI
jgi:hypothetical protein